MNELVEMSERVNERGHVRKQVSHSSLRWKKTLNENINQATTTNVSQCFNQIRVCCVIYYAMLADENSTKLLSAHVQRGEGKSVEMEGLLTD